MDRLVTLLELEALDADLFLGDPGEGTGRLFGGMVAAQSAMAAMRTVEEKERHLHSIHGYFLRPGRHDVPIRFVVDRIRDGRSFTTRRVKAHQAGEAIFNLSASFVTPEDGIEHQEEMPEAPDPQTVSDWEEMRTRMFAEATGRLKDEGGPVDGPKSAIEVRPCESYGLDPDPERVARARTWMRVDGSLPPDPMIHTAMMVYMSDRTLLSTAARPHGLPWGQGMGASLDHAVWIHGPIQLDDWVLYASDSPVARHARGLIFGGFFRRDGTRMASVAQEVLIRYRR